MDDIHTRRDKYGNQHYNTARTWQLALVRLKIVVAQHDVPDNCYGLRLGVDQLCGGATAKIAVV